MNEEIKSEIIVELRKSRNVITCIFVLIAAWLAYNIIENWRGVEQCGNCWYDVRTELDRQQFPKALTAAKALVAAQPDYDYGRTELGFIYLAMDDLTNAEAQYTKAYELFPSKEHKEYLEAVQTRIATGGKVMAK
ncbi:MAG TPA: hypothetical protein VH619_02380 [Verrucomicrobiae bacterium]|nr:hypothetical protein [Verrucomicrobiae bacterium]